MDAGMAVTMAALKAVTMVVSKDALSVDSMVDVKAVM